jgi:hypothetical protein
MDGCLTGCLSFILLLFLIGFLGMILENPLVWIFLLCIFVMYMCCKNEK